MDIERALKNIGDWISKETESRKYPKSELLELSESLQALNAEIARQSVKSDIGETSDGYHTFNELYEHRTALFATLCNMMSDISWKSMKHDDGTMYEGMFIAGIETPDGQYTYHCDMKYLYMFAYTPEVEKAPPYDGHQPSDYPRLLGLSENSLYHRYGQPTTSEEVAEAILLVEELAEIHVPEWRNEESSMKVGDDCSINECLMTLAITALQVYQPTISKTETTSCEWCEIASACEYEVAFFKDDERWATERSLLPKFCPNCGRQLD